MEPGPLPVPRTWAGITPAWMTAALSPRLPGVAVRSVEVGPVTRGTNDRATVRLAYDFGAGPATVFVKREGRWRNRLALSALRAVDAEARLVSSGVSLPVEHPGFLAAAVDRRRLAAVVVLEDVRRRGGVPNAPRTPLAVDQVADGLTGLARMHAAHWGRPLPHSLSFVRPWRLGAAWAPVSWASLTRALRIVRASGRADLVPSQLDATTVERGFRGWAHEAVRGPQTLLHGDPHPGNTYALPGRRTGFYDWQLVRSGSWAHDVGYFLVGSLAVADRRTHERELLDGYLAALAAGTGVAMDGDLARASYARTPAFGLGSWLHTLAGGGFQPREDCLAMIQRFASAWDDLR